MFLGTPDSGSGGPLTLLPVLLTPSLLLGFLVQPPLRVCALSCCVIYLMSSGGLLFLGGGGEKIEVGEELKEWKEDQVWSGCIV